jgi:hypothetical protein
MPNMSSQTIFAVVQRECVGRNASELPILDPAGIAGQVSAGPLLFATRQFADQWRTLYHPVDCEVVEIDAAECLRCMAYFQARGFDSVIWDRRVSDPVNPFGRSIPIGEFIDAVRDGRLPGSEAAK